MGTGFHFDGSSEWITIYGQDIPVILVLTAAAIGVEIFLALKKDWRLGLALPGLWLLKTLVQLIVWMIQVSSYSSVPAMAGMLCIAVAVENIPTLLLLVAYGLCRFGKRWKTVRQLKKSRIEDL